MGKKPKTIEELLRAAIHLTEDEIDRHLQHPEGTTNPYITQHLEFCEFCQNELESLRIFKIFEERHMRSEPDTDAAGTASADGSVIRSAQRSMSARASRTPPITQAFVFSKVIPSEVRTVMGSREHVYAARFPTLLAELGLVLLQSTTLSLVLKTTRRMRWTVQAELDPPISTKQPGAEVIDLLLDVRDDSDNSMCAAPMLLRIGAQNHSTKEDIWLSDDPTRFRGFLKLTIRQPST